VMFYVVVVNKHSAVLLDVTEFLLIGSPYVTYLIRTTNTVLRIGLR
jgi:hypothetical protein